MTASVPVVHVSIVHPPDEPRIYERECRTLAQAGYDVTYLAPGAPAGRDAYGVRRAALPLRSRTRRWLSTREIVAELRGLRPFVVHTHDPELLTLLPLLRPFVPRLVCDVHEYVAQAIMAKEYIPAGARPAISKASGFALRELAAWADGGIVAYDGMLDQFGVRPRLRMVAPNYPRLAHFEGAAPIADLAADRRLRLVYIGALSPMRGCRLMLDVMERLDRDDALLVLAVGSPPRTWSARRWRGWPPVLTTVCASWAECRATRCRATWHRPTSSGTRCCPASSTLCPASRRRSTKARRRAWPCSPAT